jgi:hypothetical protein
MTFHPVDPFGHRQMLTTFAATNRSRDSSTPAVQRARCLGAGHAFLGRAPARRLVLIGTARRDKMRTRARISLAVEISGILKGNRRSQCVGPNSKKKVRLEGSFGSTNAGI